MIDQGPLGEYLNDHAAGAEGAIDMPQQRLEEDADPRIAALPLDDLIGRADEQTQTVASVRIEVGRDALMR